MKKYEDTTQGVRECIKNMYQKDFINPDSIIPDPWKDNVWIAIDTEKELALIVYLEENDAEIVPYRDANYQRYLRS